MSCLSCHAETTNGLALCELCQRRATDCLAFLPVYFRNLARWKRSARPNGSIGTAGEWIIRRGETEANHISVALERASNDLGTWARCLAEDRPGFEIPDADTEAEAIAALCDALAVNITSVATLEWAGQFVRDVDRHERNLRALTERYVPGWYAGGCRHCESATFVVPGITWVTCGGCGSTTFARDHLPAVLDEARGWVARPMRLAEAVVALVDTEVSVPRVYERIKKWEQRERIEAIRQVDRDGDATGPKCYRFGDVLDRLLTEGPTRLVGPVDAQVG